MQESIAATGATGIGTPFARYGQSLLAKVRSSLPPSLLQTLDALGAILGSATVPAKDFSSSVKTIERLTQVALQQRRVRMRYYSLHRNALTERVVDPYVIYFDPDGATLKLIAYDYFRSKIIPFAIDHIRSIQETNERFKRPTNFKLRDYLTKNCFNGIHGLRQNPIPQLQRHRRHVNHVAQKWMIGTRILVCVVRGLGPKDK